MRHPGILRASLATAGVAVSAAAAWQAWLIRRAAQRGRRLAAVSMAYQTRPPAARSRVLVLGDSTAVGVGAETADASLAGLLAARFPHTEIVNRAFNGARLRDLAAQVEQLSVPEGRFDLALLLAGGNDVLRFTGRRSLVVDADRLLNRLRHLAGFTVWMGCADVGRSPAFVPPWSWWLSRRTARTMQLLARQAGRHGACFIDFTRSPPPGLGFAGDGVHPDSGSYRRCFEALLQRAPLADALLRR